jgi:hypothetical protein
MLITSCEAPAETVTGNTAGNIANTALAAYYEGYIYYIDYGKSNNIYKISEDGTEKTKLNSETSLWLNVIDGWVYYSNNDDRFLYKVRTDGTEHTQLTFKEENRFWLTPDPTNRTKLTAVENDSIWYMTIEGGFIYYSNLAGMNYLYKMKTDGTERAVLSPEAVIDINIVGDWIYYVNEKAETYYIYRIRKDGTNRQLILNENCAFVNVSGGYIYYINYDDNNKIYRMQTNRRGKKALSDDYAEWMNVSDGYIYYRNASDNNYLYKIKTDGTEKTRLNEDNTSMVNIAGDWIYYVSIDSETGERTFCRIKKDGSGKQLVSP